MEICLCIPGKDKRSSSLRSVSSPRPGSPSSEYVFGTIKTQLDECLDGLHDLCPTPTPTPLPRRVLRLGDSDEDVKLEEYPNVTIGDYIALSHCWGGQQPIKTTTQNIQDFLAQVPWGQLSNVFRDAIRVCRQFNVFHLWIDSLCIIQDSAADWEEESSKMGSYYSNARFTIAAASSRIGTISFLADRPPKWQPQRFSEASSTHQREITVWAQRTTTGGSLRRDDPIASRAWTFQELVLSRRVLYYGSDQVVWICRSQIEGVQIESPLAGSALWMPYKLAQAMHLPGERSPYSFWAELLNECCQRDITFISDRLPALSGIVAEMKTVFKSKYAAGLWVENMPTALLWERELNSSQTAVGFAPTEYLAPTWSWASISGPIIHRRFLIDSMVEIIDVHCHVPGLNPYGRVHGGYLDLHARRASLRASRADTAQRGIRLVQVLADIDKTGLLPVVDPVVEWFSPDCILAGSPEIGGLKRAREGDDIVPFEVDVPCILLGKDLIGANNFAVLMLGLSDVPGEYTRVGLASIASDDIFRCAPFEKFRLF